MKFYKDLPHEPKFDSAKVIGELQNHPGEHGEFWVQRSSETTKQARQKATSLRAYVKRLGLPVIVTIQVDDNGLVHCFASWTG